MEPYKSKHGNSGVVAYESGKDYIRLLFRDRPEVYTYSNRSAGKANVNRMKQLAKQGEGLSGFVSRNVRDKFEH